MGIEDKLGSERPTRRGFLGLGAVALAGVLAQCPMNYAFADGMTRIEATRLQKLVEQDPCFDNQINLANAYMELKKYENAKQQFLTAAEVRPDTEESFVTLARDGVKGLSDSEQYVKSIELNNRIRQDIPYDISLHRMLGLCKLKIARVNQNYQTAEPLAREGFLILYGTQIVEDSENNKRPETLKSISQARTHFKARFPNLYKETQQVEQARKLKPDPQYDLRKEGMEKEAWNYAFEIIDSCRKEKEFDLAIHGYEYLIKIGVGPRVRKAQTYKRRAEREKRTAQISKSSSKK